MADGMRQVLVDEGFSSLFLNTLAGRRYEVRQAIMWNIGTTPWYRCATCKDYFVRVRELPDHIPGYRGEDLRELQTGAQTHGFCCGKCRQAMAKELGEDVSIPLMTRASMIALRPDFYQSPEWRDVRYKALKKHGAACQCCGAKPPPPLHVDHIKPRITHPYLALHIGNLQVLCADCNKGKGWKDDTDWRPHDDVTVTPS